MMNANKLTYVDLEGDIHDAINMAEIVLDRLHDHFAIQPADGSHIIDAHSAALSLFAAGMAVEKASAVFKRWKEVHASNGGEL
jgi:hypothetical protein